MLGQDIEVVAVDPPYTLPEIIAASVFLVALAIRLVNV